MKKILCVCIILLILCNAFASGKKDEPIANTVRVIEDMAGRTVELPHSIERVFSTNPIGTMFLYTIAPEMMVAWNFEPTEIEKQFIASEQKNLPALGQDSKINYEAVIAVDPDIIIVYFQSITDKLSSDIASIEKSTGLPVIAIKGQLIDADETYDFLGKLLDKEKQSKMLSNYVCSIFEQSENLEIKDKKSLYYGNGLNSLETVPLNSPSSQELDLARVLNVADVTSSSASRVDISSEQLIAWNPDIILLNGDPKRGLTQGTAVEDFCSNNLYKDLNAVKNGTVYGVPKAPFSWVGRPIGINRLIGVQWISHLAYPELQTKNFDDVVKEFYSLFYHIELNDSDIKKLYE